MCKQRVLGLAVLGLLACGFAGCGMQAYTAAAEATAGQFYQALAARNWDAAVALCSPESSQIPREQWRALLIKRWQIMGDYQSHRLEGWRYNAHTDAQRSPRLTVLTYRVQYARGEAVEQLSFEGNPDGGPLLIAAYDSKPQPAQAK